MMKIKKQYIIQNKMFKIRRIQIYIDGSQI